MFDICDNNTQQPLFIISAKPSKFLSGIEARGLITRYVVSGFQGMAAADSANRLLVDFCIKEER